jgi:hypothetical protein
MHAKRLPGPTGAQTCELWQSWLPVHFRAHALPTDVVMQALEAHSSLLLQEHFAAKGATSQAEAP